MSVLDNMLLASSENPGERLAVRLRPYAWPDTSERPAHAHWSSSRRSASTRKRAEYAGTLSGASASCSSSRAR